MPGERKSTRSYLHQLTGWYNGDFDCDGIINGSDYTLIDNAFNTQGARIASQIAQPASLVATQSPTGAGWVIADSTEQKKQLQLMLELLDREAPPSKR